jgi:3-oxoacyl-[acyl-carrier protein] reductase
MVELCNGLLPGMVEQRWGRVLAITSTGVRQPLSAMVNSNAARAGLTGYLKTLAREVIGQGITVNSILPGSQMTARLESLIGERMEGYIANHPAGRAGEPEDFGKIATFLCSEPANYLTGVALSVDGGADSSLI